MRNLLKTVSNNCMDWHDIKFTIAYAVSLIFAIVITSIAGMVFILVLNTCVEWVGVSQEYSMSVTFVIYTILILIGVNYVTKG